MTNLKWARRSSISWVTSSSSTNTGTSSLLQVNKPCADPTRTERYCFSYTATDGSLGPSSHVALLLGIIETTPNLLSPSTPDDSEKPGGSAAVPRMSFFLMVVGDLCTGSEELREANQT